MSNDNNHLERQMPLAIIFFITIVGFYFLLAAIPLAIIYFVGRRVSPKRRLLAFVMAIFGAIFLYFIGLYIPQFIPKSIGVQALSPEKLLFMTVTGFVLGYVIDCTHEEPEAFRFFPRKSAPNPEESEPKSRDGNETHQDEDFDFNSSRFRNGGAKSTRQTPYGVDKRHPDDAVFWAFVDDPNASDQERKTALEKILKRQAKRTGKTGRDATAPSV